MSLTFAEMEEIVRAIAYKPGWTLALREDGARAYLQVQVGADTGVCAQTGQATAWNGAKHYLSQHMCRQEIVGMAFTAFRQAEEHELREWFRYRGAAIFNPHLDVDQLAAFARRRENFDFRDAPMVTR